LSTIAFCKKSFQIEYSNQRSIFLLIFTTKQVKLVKMFIC
jgi:hypothetical protein